MSRLLIVDDEKNIREVIGEYADNYGYEIDMAENGLEAVEKVAKNQYDCIILDIMMPVMDGQTACKKIKEISNTPIIMLSARSEEEDKLSSFEEGVDDYVTKPFSLKELMARIKVAISRNSQKKPEINHSLISFYGITVDLEGHEVKVDNEIVHLTNKEYELLLYFYNNPNIVLTRELLLEKIWGFDFIGIDRTVDTHIKMLRKNLGVYGDKIITVRGVGYKFER